MTTTKTIFLLYPIEWTTLAQFGIDKYAVEKYEEVVSELRIGVPEYEFITLMDYINLYQLRALDKLVSALNRDTCFCQARKIAASVDEVWFIGGWKSSSICRQIHEFCKTNKITVQER